MRQLRWTPAVLLLVTLLGCDVNISGNNLSGNISGNIDASGNKIGIGKDVNMGGDVHNGGNQGPPPAKGLYIERAPQRIYTLPEGFNPSPAPTMHDPNDPNAPKDDHPTFELGMHAPLRVMLVREGDIKDPIQPGDLDLQLPSKIRRMEFAPPGGGMMETYLFAEPGAATGTITFKMTFKPNPEITDTATASVVNVGGVGLLFE